MKHDHGTRTEQDAARFARVHDDGTDDRPTLADVTGDQGTTSAEERFARTAGYCSDCGDQRTICPACLGTHCGDQGCMPLPCATVLRRVRAEVERLWGTA